MLRPGLDTAATDLAAVVGRDWSDSTHRQALSDLVLSAWTPCGIGDWAVTVRSPDGRLAARVCPFDPAYAAFVELCRRCGDNPYLPRVHLSADLDGGGTLTVMEYLAPARHEDVTRLVDRWKHDDGDTDLKALKNAAMAVDAEHAATAPWWDGIDLNANNVRQSLDGQLVFIDVFCMDGAALYEQVLQDAAVVRRRIVPDQCRHLLDIPYIARESSPDEIRDLAAAWTASTRAEVPISSHAQDQQADQDEQVHQLGQ